MKLLFGINRRTLSPKEKIRVFLIIIMLFPFFMPGGISYITGFEYMNIVFHILKFGSIFLYILILKGKVNGLKSKNVIWLAIGYGLGISIANLIHEFSLLSLRTAIFFPTLVFICVGNIRRDKFSFITAVYYLSGLYNFFQIITVIFYYPNGIDGYVGYYWEATLAGAKYFFGGKNQSISYMLVFLLSLIVRESINGKYYIKKVYIYTLIFLVEALLLGSANATVCLILFLLLYTAIILKLYIKIPILFNPRMYIAINIYIFLAICIFLQVENMIGLTVILNLLKRNVTFTNRTYIWKITLNYFMSSPLVGVGEISFPVLSSVQSQAHTIYLDILFKYGLIAFIPYLASVLYIGRQLSFQSKTYIGAATSSVFFILLLRNCFDVMDNYIYILLMCIFYMVNEINKGEQHEA